MTQEIQNEEPQEARIAPVSRISRIWLIPLVALSIGLWMVYYQWSNQGPVITIIFSTAQGLEPDNTKIKARNLDIGVVKKIELTPDMEGVLVTARIDKNAAHLLRSDSTFWVVTPRISLSGVSGLNTLLSGPYIALSPGEFGEETDTFVALDEPPVTPPGTPGLHVTLNSNDEFAFKEGDPIIYKGLKVGEFEDIYFNLEERIVYYNAFIEAPYHQLITENTKFWNTSGVSFELATSGFQIKTGSVETILTNGVTFGVPEGMPLGKQITERDYFDIYPDYQTASDQRYKLGVNFVVMIEETVRGLEVGAPVEYRGLEIGRVLVVNLRNPEVNGILDQGYSIPVLITIQPGRVGRPDTEIGQQEVESQIRHWINNGLKASLKMGNLLTGALYVDLQHYDEPMEGQIISYLNNPVIPTRSDEFAQITQKLTALLDTFNALPINELGGNANGLLEELNTVAQSINATVNRVDSLLVTVEDKAVADKLATSLSSFNTLLNDYTQGSKSHRELLQTLSDFQSTMNQLMPLIEQLNRHPDSLIFGQEAAPYRQPKAKQVLQDEN